MVSLEEAMRYIEYYRNQGYSDNAIAQGLYAQGYTEELVREAYDYLDGKKDRKPNRKPLIIFMIIAIMIFIAGGVGFYAFSGGDNNSTTTTTTTSIMTTSTNYKQDNNHNINNYDEKKQKKINFHYRVKLCDYVDKFNDITCYPNPYDEFVLGDPIYVYFKPILEAKKMGDVYKIGFTQSRRFYDPSGNELEKYSGVIIDKDWTVDSEGTYNVPAYNMLETNESMPIGNYVIELTIKDKYSKNEDTLRVKVSLI